MHLCGRALLHAKCPDHRLWHALPGPANLEVLQGPLRLRSPVPTHVKVQFNQITWRASAAQRIMNHVSSKSHLSAGTSSGPNVSFSVRVAGVEKWATPMMPVRAPTRQCDAAADDVMPHS